MCECVSVWSRMCFGGATRRRHKRLIDHGIAYNCLRNLQKLIHCKFYEFVKINVGEILGLADGLSVGAKVLTLCSADKARMNGKYFTCLKIFNYFCQAIQTVTILMKLYLIIKSVPLSFWLFRVGSGGLTIASANKNQRCT